MDDLTKLRHLIKHWIEHTEEHAKEFENWAKKIENFEDGKEIAETLRKAKTKLEEIIVLLSSYK